METEKKAEPKKQTPRFIHFGWHGQTMLPGKKKHNGALTIAYRQTDSALRVGFVFCSPSDNFSRKEGRNDALRTMRNYPIILPLKPDKFNRDLILELVNFLCGIGPKGKTWDIPHEAIYKSHSDHFYDKQTSRIPGWAKKWWLGIVKYGSPMGKHQTPSKEFDITSSKSSFPLNVFDVTVAKFFRQAREAGVGKVTIVLG